MSTNQVKPTPGPVIYEGATIYRQTGPNEMAELCSLRCSVYRQSQDANAQLIKDAFDVHTETGLTRREAVPARPLRPK